ncbi:MAG: ATP-binding cassette domain-containing protein [Ruminococcus sp.]|nr:ATP-binding cassette domain-containing protein [Ruminococcus sp.]MBQ4247017.1 ATP-binding cassette domain-containing protein [Ruminococcus sp.]
MIEVRNISKRYGSQKAVEDVSFCVNEGEILGFLGPNGAGKSTVMNIITGYISSTSGKVLVDGKDIVEAPAYAKKQMGYLPEIPPLYEDMTVKEYLYFIYDLKKCKLPKISHMKDICSLVGIDDVYSKVIKNLSKGYKQRVGFAQALVGDPKILILDEPTVGLDPRQIAEIRSLIRKLGKRHTVILSSHILPEIQAVCDRIVVINHGKIVANDTEENILTAFEGEKKLFLTVEGAGRDAIRSALERLPGVKSVSFSKERKGSLDVEITAQKDSDIRKDVFDTAAGNGWTILEMRSSKLTLEEIFIRLTENGTQVQEEVG